MADLGRLSWSNPAKNMKSDYDKSLSLPDNSTDEIKLKGSSKPMKLCRKISETYHPVFYDNTFWLYNKDYGYYERYNNEKLEALIFKTAEYSDKISSYIIKETIAKLRMIRYTDTPCFCKNHKIINFTNGMINLDYPEKLLLHDHELRINNIIKADYSDDVIKFKNTELGRMIYSICGSEEKFKLLQEFLGVIMSNLPTNKCFFIIGKSQFLKVVLTTLLYEAMGLSELSAVDLYSLYKPKSLKYINHSQLNIGTCKFNTQKENIEILQKILELSPVYIDDKIKILDTELLFIGESLPEIPTEHFEIFNLLNVLHIEDNNISINNVFALRENLYQYVNSFAMWAFKGALRYFKNGYRFTEDKDSLKHITNHKRICNSVKTFIDTCLRSAGEKDFISKTELYEVYTNFCNNNQLKSVSPETLYATIISQIPTALLKRNNVDGKYIHTIRGIYWKNQKT